MGCRNHTSFPATGTLISRNTASMESPHALGVRLKDYIVCCESRHYPGLMTPSFARALRGEINTGAHHFKSALRNAVFETTIPAVSASEPPKTKAMSWLPRRDYVSRCLAPEEGNFHIRRGEPCTSPSTVLSLASWQTRLRRHGRRTIYLGGLHFLMLCPSQCYGAKEAVPSHLGRSQQSSLILTSAMDYRTCVNNGGLLDSHECRLRVYFTDMNCSWAWIGSIPATSAVCTTAGGVHLAHPARLCKQRDIPTMVVGLCHGPTGSGSLCADVPPATGAGVVPRWLSPPSNRSRAYPGNKLAFTSNRTRASPGNKLAFNNNPPIPVGSHPFFPNGRVWRQHGIQKDCSSFRASTAWLALLLRHIQPPKARCPVQVLPRQSSFCRLSS